jgi:hypothetical protein
VLSLTEGATIVGRMTQIGTMVSGDTAMSDVKTVSSGPLATAFRHIPGLYDLSTEFHACNIDSVEDLRVHEIDDDESTSVAESPFPAGADLLVRCAFLRGSLVLSFDHHTPSARYTHDAESWLDSCVPLHSNNCSNLLPLKPLSDDSNSGRLNRSALSDDIQK